MAFYIKLDDGSWGAKGRGLVEGEIVEVRKRNGSSSMHTIGPIVREEDGEQIAQLVKIPQAKIGSYCKCHRDCCQSGCSCEATCKCRGGQAKAC